MFSMILSIWIISGFVAYGKLIYIEKLHEDESFVVGFPYKNVKLTLFLVCLLWGVLALLYVVYYDFRILLIEIQYWISTVRDKIFRNK